MTNQRIKWKESYERLRGKSPSLGQIEDFAVLVELAEKVGRGLKDEKVSSRQIRVLLSETTAAMNRIKRGATLGFSSVSNNDAQQQNKAARREATLLNIALIYHTARVADNYALHDLVDLIKTMTSDVKTFEDFKVLRKFSEAIIAYFVANGGK